MQKKEVLRYLVVLVAFSFLFFMLIYMKKGGLTGFAVFSSGPGEGQTTLMLQTANTENLGDAYVDAGIANKNKGTNTDLKIKNNPYKRTYIKFDISQVPSDQIINNSQLCLYLYDDQATQTVYASHVYVHDWNEGSEDGTDVSGQDYTTNITWNNQPCGVNFDDSSKCNLTAESSITDDGTLDGTWQCFSVTNAVLSEYASGDKNVSVVLYTESLGNPDLFYSKEYTGNTALRPYLNITYSTADSTPPNVTINSPLNQTYFATSILVDISADDENPGAIWFYDGSLNTTYTSAVNHDFPLGSNVLIVYANDSLGNLNDTESVTFYINSAPSITLVSPQDGASYGYNQSLNLDFSVSDVDDNIDSCWYSLNSEKSIIIANCENITIDVPEGSNTIEVYVNDTLGLEASDSATFSVSVGSPSIILNSPIDDYLDSQDVVFSYTPTDLDLDSCELWGDFSGTLLGVFELNQTDSSPQSESENTFSLSLGNGTYLWNIQCNDSLGNSATNGNKTFYIDTVNPSISLAQPAGTKTTRTGIPIQFSVSDQSPMICWYNIAWATGGEVTVNTTIANCSSTDFNVAADGDYVLNLFVNDSSGNQNSTTSSFSVDTSSVPETPSEGSSGGGGSGGGFVNTTNKGTELSVSLSNLEEVVMIFGESKTLSLEARNTGGLMQNNCKILASEWISSSDEKDLNANEKAEFVFSVSVPEDAEEGEHDVSVTLKCQDGEKNVNLKVSVINGGFDILIKEISGIRGNKISFTYVLKELSGENSNVGLTFLVIDSNGDKVAEEGAAVDLLAGEEKEIEEEIAVPIGTSGEFQLIVTAASKGVSMSDKENVVITGAATGLAGILELSEKTKKYVSLGIILLVGVLLGYLIISSIIKTRKETKGRGVVRIGKSKE